MVIDFHTHTFPDAIAEKTISKLSGVSGSRPFTDGTLTGLFGQMEESRIDLSVILPVVTKPEQFKTINETAARINEQFNGKVLSFGGIHPDTLDYKEELKQIKAMGLKGIKLHPDYQQVNIDDMRYMHLIDYASQLGLITVVHAGVDVGYPEPVHCKPKAARTLIDTVHPEHLVLAHMGGCDLWEEVEEYLVGQNVWLDTAFTFERMGADCFIRIAHKHGVERILFATDSPWCSQKASVEWILSLNIKETEKQLILGENARKLLAM